MQIQERRHLYNSGGTSVIFGVLRPGWQDRRGEPLPLPGHRISALVVNPRPRHAVRVCLGECQASPGTREVARWRVIGRNETRCSGCLAGQIRLPGRVRNRGASLASLLTGTAPSIGIDSVHSDIPSRRTSTGRCGAAWVLSHQKKVTQSRRADPVPEGIGVHLRDQPRSGPAHGIGWQSALVSRSWRPC
jgi:hypothetical protein